VILTLGQNDQRINSMPSGSHLFGSKVNLLLFGITRCPGLPVNFNDSLPCFDFWSHQMDIQETALQRCSDDVNPFSQGERSLELARCDPAVQIGTALAVLLFPADDQLLIFNSSSPTCYIL